MNLPRKQSRTLRVKCRPNGELSDGRKAVRLAVGCSHLAVHNRIDRIEAVVLIYSFVYNEKGG
ncbi:MAG: hypothetical protein J1F03_04215 [Oscillospiraceae bacterium]|nr:hypothetical protein [Oscillospiraceae bacterium]